MDDSTDRRFERRLRWLLILVLLIGLLFTGGNFLLTPLAFAEMPNDNAKVRVERGYATVVVNGVSYDLEPGDEIYVAEADHVKVGIRSRASVTYRGGASSILCAGTDLTVGRLVSVGTPVSPSAHLVLHDGLALMDTQSTSPAFTDLDAAVTLPDGVATNQGQAWFAVAPWGVQVSQGKVVYQAAVYHADGKPIGCGDGTVVERPSTGPTLTPSTGVTPSATPSETPTPTLPPPRPSPDRGSRESRRHEPPPRSPPRNRHHYHQPATHHRPTGHDSAGGHWECSCEVEGDCAATTAWR